MKKKLSFLTGVFLMVFTTAATAQYVGIGTTNPQYPLDVKGVINADSGFYNKGNLVLSDSVMTSKKLIGDSGYFKTVNINTENIPLSNLPLNVHGGINTDVGLYLNGTIIFRDDSNNDNLYLGKAIDLLNIHGIRNTFLGDAAGTIIGNVGSWNTAVGMQSHTENGASSAVALGYLATANYDNSIAIGANSVAPSANTIRLGDNAITAIYAKTGITITSDFYQKEKFLDVDDETVLQKIKNMKLESWNYKGQDASQFRHYGPIAQEFYSAFGKDAYGNIGNDTTINSQDLAGINLIAIQALEKRTQPIEILQKENAALKNELADLRRQMAGQQERVEAILKALETPITTNKQKTNKHKNL